MFAKLMKTKEIKEIERENIEPIDKETIENIVKLIETAYSVGCEFDLHLELTIGDFCVDSASYNGIKLINNKKDGDKLLIKQKNMLLLNETYIDLENIVHATFNLKLCDKNNEEGD